MTLEDLCKVSECKKFVDGGCTVFHEGGRQFRMRYGYCPIPDYPRGDKSKAKERIGQAKSKIKKKK